MSDRIFVDTNVLVYAHDADAGERHAAAAKAVADLWESRNGIISTQVLHEFYVALTRKVASPVTRSVARGLIRNYLTSLLSKTRFRNLIGLEWESGRK